MIYYIFKKETWWSLAGVVLAFLVLILILPFSVDTKPQKKDGFTVMIDYGNGVGKKFQWSPNGKSTAWDTLQQASAHSFLEVAVAPDFYPTSIDQKENGKEGKHWILYINNERIFSSPIEVKISSGDEILWKFE